MTSTKIIKAANQLKSRKCRRCNIEFNNGEKVVRAFSKNAHYYHKSCFVDGKGVPIFGN